jgi:hypothetical protein
MAEPTPPDDKPAPKPEAAKPAAAAEKPAAAAEPTGGEPTPAAKPAAAKAGAKPGAGAKAAAPAAPVEIAAPTMKAEIRARVRKGRPGRFDVKPDGSVLGRDDAAGVPILLDGVSREHARIKWDGKGWWLEDLKSTNGTFVNGEKVLRERLQHLDVISLGRKADVVFMLRGMDAEVPATRPGVVRAALVEADDGTVTRSRWASSPKRSSACNVVANGNAVLKVHARIGRRTRWCSRVYRPRTAPHERHPGAHGGVARHGYPRAGQRRQVQGVSSGRSAQSRRPGLRQEKSSRNSPGNGRRATNGIRPSWPPSLPPPPAAAAGARRRAGAEPPTGPNASSRARPRRPPACRP